MTRRHLDQRLKLSLLRAVDAIEIEGSLVKASVTLGISQPALTKNLQELEGILQVRLFDRHSRGIIATPQGEVFIRAARRILADLRRLEEDLDEYISPSSGTVAVGALPVAAAGVLPSVIARLRTSHPNIKIRLQQGRTTDLVPFLASGELDIIVGRLYEPALPDGFKREALWSEPIAIFARSEHPIFSDAVSVESLRRYDLILPTVGQRVGEEIEHLLERLGLEPTAPLRSSSYDFIREVLCATDSISIMPCLMLLGDLLRGALRTASLPIPAPARPAGIILPRDRLASPTTRAFVQCLRDYISEIVTRGLTPTTISDERPFQENDTIDLVNGLNSRGQFSNQCWTGSSKQHEGERKDPPSRDIRGCIRSARRYLDQRLRLALLRVVDAVETQGSLLKASAALGISQPTLTKNLQELEDILQLRLFDRHSRGVVPTPQGKVFIQAARRILADLRRLEENLDEYASPSSGTVAVGALPGAAAGVVMPGVIARLRTSHPNIKVRLQHGLMTDLVAQLESGELDLIVGRLYEPALPDGFEREVLWSDPISILARSQHPVFSEAIRVESLRRYDLILPSLSQRVGQEIEHLVAKLGLEPTAPLRSNSDTVIREVLCATDSISIMPRLAFFGDVLRGTLRTAPFPIPTPPRPAGLILPCDRIVSPAVRALIQCLQRYISEIVVGGTAVMAEAE
jgi:LysR family transcriptional regulator, pca operon transcriptional activator